MTLNCKPGDLAVIVNSQENHLNGRFVTVGYAAPLLGDFRLPNGQMHCALSPSKAPWWVCEFSNAVEAPVSLPSGLLFRRKTTWAPVPDAFLRPIRPQPDDAQDETLIWCPRPEQVEAMS